MENTLVYPPNETKHKGTVIFLHGACDTGIGLSDWIAHRLGRSFTFRHLKVVFPTASWYCYSPADGRKSTVWFDFPQGIQYDVLEDRTGMESRVEEISAIIRNEIKNGVPPDKIVLGGLSQGGILGLTVGLKFEHKLAGIFALSSYLPEKSSLLEQLTGDKSERQSRAPVYMTHGDKDQLIRLEWGRSTMERLKDLGIPTTFKEYPGLGHDLSKEEIEDLETWILDQIPH